MCLCEFIKFRKRVVRKLQNAVDFFPYEDEKNEERGEAAVFK